MLPFAELPPQHVARPRLLDRLEGAPLATIVAGGGFGKSVLAADLRRRLGIASAEAVLEGEVEGADQLVAELRRGLRRAGLSDLAAGLGTSSAAAVVEALERAGEPVLLVVDEVQRARGDAAQLIAELAGSLPDGARLALVGQDLDPALERSAGSLGAVRLGSEELTFDPEEIAALLGEVLGHEPSPTQVEDVGRLTAGWPAATALVAAGLARGPDAGTPPPSAGAAPLRGPLEDLLGPLDPEQRRRVGRLAHLPLLSEGVAEACAGPGSLQLIVETGLPLRAERPGWMQLPDPVRDALAEREPLPVGAGRAAAGAYAEAGELPTGLSLLARSEDPEGVAALIASVRWQELEALDLTELRAILATLPASSLAAEPFALVQTARLAERKGDYELRRRLLTDAVGLVSEPGQRREVVAELVATRATLEPGDEVVHEAETLLETAGAGEPAIRARALIALARVAAWHGDPASMLRAEQALGEAAALCRIAGETEWEADTLTSLGYRVEFARGDLDQSIAHMSAALALLPQAGSERAAVATFLAEALAYVGRFEEAEATLREATAIGRRLGDHRAQAYAAWTGVTLASLRGDTASVLQRARSVELHPGDWFEHPTGIEFLADAALALARTGAQAEARAYADRAQIRAEAAGHPEIAWIAEGALAARWGNPDAAELALTQFADSPQQAPRDEWRTLLLRALAAARREDPLAGRLAAQAYETAAALGRVDLPDLHEPDVAAVVAPLAEAGGSRALAERSSRERTYVITLLGSFAVTVDGKTLELPAGRPSTLVKLLALAGGPLRPEEAIEVLWPGTDDATGRQRLRNLLNRLRTSCGDLVRRDGDTLVLGPAQVDARGFESDAEAALAAGGQERPGLARAALARYRSGLLPGDRYEPWVASARERLQRRYLELLDLLTDDAVDRGDVDEAIRMLDRAQVAEPLDENRYLRAAELLLFQGRRGSAQTLIERAAKVREELGLGDSEQLARLRAATGAS